MIYGSLSYFSKYFDYERIKDYELWIACWDNKIGADYRPLSGSTSGFEHPHQFWQYFSKSPVKGIDESSAVDLDQAVIDYDGAKSPK